MDSPSPSGAVDTCPLCAHSMIFDSGPSCSRDRKSTRLNSSHGYISYAVFCLKKKTNPVHDTKGNLLPSLNNLQLAWFDRWLKGVANGIERFPEVETYSLGAGHCMPDPRYHAY